MKKLFVLILAALLVCSARAETAFAPQGAYQVFEQEGLYGVRMAGDGAVLVPAGYDSVYPIQDGCCMVYKDGEWAAVYELEKGVRVPLEGMWNISIVGKFLIADGTVYNVTTGEEVTLGCEADCLYPAGDGRHIIAERDEQGFTVFSALLDENGTVLLAGDISILRVSEDGIAAVVNEKGRVRYLDTASVGYIGAEYMIGSDFNDGYAAVMEAPGCYYMIDRTGKRVTGDYEHIWFDVYTVCTAYGCFAYTEEGAWYIGRVNEELSGADVLFGPCYAEGAEYLGDGVWAFCSGSETWLFSTETRRELTVTGYVSDFGDGFAYYEQDGLYGYLSDELTVITPPRFADATEFLGEYAFVLTEDGYHPINGKGELVPSVCYSSVYVCEMNRGDFRFCCETEEGVFLVLNEELEPVTAVLRDDIIWG